MFDLTGKVALVTGAGQGVGTGIAVALASQGASVAMNDVVTERAEACAEQLTADLAVRPDPASPAAPADSPQVIAAPFDVTSLEEVRLGVATAASELGPIDILVNNAGNAGAHDFNPTHFSELDPSHWEKFIAVNLIGVMNCTKAVLPAMQDRSWGRIITVSSGAGQSGLNIGVSIYGAAKGGSIAFMRHIAIENAGKGITANSLALGLMDTISDPEVTQHLARGIPVGRLGSPDDIGPACVWLASDEAAWVTNQTIGINGGSLPS